MASTTQTTIDLSPHADDEDGAGSRPGPRSRRTTRRDPAALWLGALAFLIGTGFVLVDLAYNQGKLIAPLDDVYIHLQYGSQLGRGNFFEYNAGDGVSTGASSLLYAFVLGFGYLIGFSGTTLLAYAVAFGIVCFALTVMGSYLLGKQLLGHRQAGVWTGVLVALSGPLAWGSTTGMEVSLVSALIVGTVLVFVREAPGNRFVGTPLMGILLALVRPEGLIFAGCLCVAAWWTLLRAVRKEGLNRGTAIGRAMVVVLPLLAGAAQLLFYKIATGQTSANGIQAKSYLSISPVLYLEDFADRVLATLRTFIDTFNGISTRDFFFPGALFLFAAGFVYLVVKRPQWRALVIAMLVGTLAIFGTISTMSSALWHNLRYVQPLIPIFVLFIVAAVFGLSRLVTNSQARRVAPHTVLAVIMVFSLITLPTWALRLGRQSATIRDSVVSVGVWMNGNLPKDARVGVIDVGAAAYFSDRYVIDLVGLATNGLARPHNNGVGATYEALRRLPADKRPDHYAIYEEFGKFVTDMRNAGLLQDPALLTSEAKSPAYPVENRVTPYDRLFVFKADWSLSGSGDEIRTQGTVRDYVNVGDLVSEDEHGYTPRMAHVGVQPWSLLKRMGNVLDSGREIVGGEEFTARNLVPNQSVTLTSRAEVTGGEMESTVIVNGKAAGTWKRTSQGTDWKESTFTIPADLVTGSSLDIEVVPTRALLGPYPDYRSFGYWISQ